MNALLIFIRPPEKGRVKTRLAATVGDDEALRIYEFLLERTRHAALGVHAARWLFYSESPKAAGDDWPEAEFHKSRQHGADLGERMQNAFAEVFEAGATRAVIIGSDCPELNGAVLEQAFAALETHDFVLGPTPDGGYYLLGMNTLQPTLFENMPWSTDAVRPQTIERIQRLGQSLCLLPELSDIDTEADWRAFEERLIGGVPPFS